MSAVKVIEFTASQHVGVFVELKTHSTPEKKVVICTTHLTGDPKKTDIRIKEVDQLFSSIEDLYDPLQVPLIFCGDLNSKPQSELYHFIKTGSVPIPSKTDLSSSSNSIVEDPEEIDSSTSSSALDIEGAGHNLSLASAFSSRGFFEEPPFTFFTDKIKSTMYDLVVFALILISDYIWFANNVFDILVVESQWVDVDKEKKPIPNQKYSSDHVIIAAVFEWKDKEVNKS